MLAGRHCSPSRGEVRSHATSGGGIAAGGKRRTVALLAVACVVFAISAGAAKADRDLFVGVDEDALKTRPKAAVAAATDLGLRAFRITLSWRPEQTALTDVDRELLATATQGRGEMRIVLAVYGRTAPSDAERRDNYCTYVRNVVTEFPQINDVVIWNEPNLSGFWWPQFDADGTSAAPASYERLLARCYDVLHDARPSINVIAPATSLWGNDNPLARDNVSHSPVNFVRELGRAYRASGRQRPIFDTFGHHPHPGDASERPWKTHDATQISEGDVNKLIDVLRDEFFGTAQAVPGNGLSIWYLEDGYQTITPPEKRLLYWGVENWPHVIPDYAGGEPDWPPPSADSPAPDQYTQIIDAVRLAYCQPYVGAYFNFLLWDERPLDRWQSGVFWADGTPKASYPAFKQVIHEVNTGTVDCARLKGGPIVAPPPLRTAGRSAHGPNSGGTADRGSVGERARLRYTGTRIGPFGFVKLRARLATASGKAIRRRDVLFELPGRKIVARSNRRGIATAHLGLPLRTGGRYVTVRFGGDSVYRAVTTRIRVTVLNSSAIVRSQGFLRLAGGRRAVFRIVSRNGKVRGRFVFRSRTIRLKAARVTAVGIGPRGRAVWFTGRTRRGRQFFAWMSQRRHRVLSFQVWASGAPRNGHGRVVSGRVIIRPAS